MPVVNLLAAVNDLEVATKAPPQVETVEDDDVNGIGGVAKNVGLSTEGAGGYEGTRESVFSGFAGKLGGVDTGVSGVGFGPKVEGEKGKGVEKRKAEKKEKRETLFHLKEAPGTKHCCVSIPSSAGGLRVCGEKLDDGDGALKKPVCRFTSHRELQPVPKLLHPALYCRAAKVGRGAGEAFLCDRQSCIHEKELAPGNELQTWRTEKATKAEWTSKIHELRADRAKDGETQPISRVIQFEKEEGNIFKNSYTPMKKERAGPGSEPSYDFVDEGDFDIEAPVMDKPPKAVFATPVKSQEGLLDVIEAFRLAILEQWERMDRVNEFAVQSDQRSGERTKEVVMKLNHLVEVAGNLKRHLGKAKEFENVTGWSNVFDGLLGLHRELGMTANQLRTELTAEIELGNHGVLQEVGKAETRTDVMDTKVDVIGTMMKDMKLGMGLLEEQQRDAEGTFAMTMQSLSSDILPALLTMKKEFYQDPNKSLATRVKRLEGGSTGTAVGSNLLSAVSHTGALGTNGVEIGGLQAQMQGILARLDQLEVENAHLRQTVGELSVGTVTRAESMADVPPMLEEIPRMQLRIANLELKDQDQISVAGLVFGGVSDCKQFLKGKMVFNSSSVFLGHDIVSLIGNVSKEGEASIMDDVLARDHNAIKGGFDNILAAALYASMQKAIPTSFSGSGSHPLPRINTFEKWDQQDGERGVRYEIQRGVDHEVSQTLGWLGTELASHPQAYMVFTSLIMDAKQHWLALATFLTDRRGICMQQSGDVEESWTYPCEVVKGLLMELYKVRSIGAHRSSLKVLTLDDASRMMWGVLKCHQLMNDLVRNRLTPRSLDPVKGKIEVLQREVSAFQGKLNKKKDK